MANTLKKGELELVFNLIKRQKWRALAFPYRNEGPYAIFLCKWAGTGSADEDEMQ